MKKIALLVPNYENSGGVKTVANFIREAIEKKGFQTQIISLSVSYNDPNSKLLFKPHTWFKKSLLNQCHDCSRPQILVGAKFPEIETNRYKPRKELTDTLNKFDIIQVVAGTPAWAYVCLNIKRPVVLQVATLTEIEREAKMSKQKGFLGYWKRVMTDRVSKLDHKGLSLVDAIMVENKWMEELLVEKGYNEKTYFAPPGVDTNVFKPGNKKDETNLSSKYLLTVGRLGDPRKDISTLFKAFSIIKQRNSQKLKLVLAGKTMPGEEDLKLAKQLGIYKSLIFFEDVSLKKLVHLYQHAEVFVLSSREEGLGMVIMEAMACGTAVVSTDSGGPATLIEDGYNGYLTEIGNSRQLARRIANILENEELKNDFIKKSLNKINSTFTTQNAIKKYIDTYRELWS